MDFFGGPFNLDALFSAIKYKRDFKKAHPEFFGPDGILVFCGGQGEGKTLSAVQYVLKLKKAYPQCIVVSNVRLLALAPADYIFVSGVDQMADAMRDVSNGYAGVIYFIDEIHNLFSSLESKNIPINIVQEISQQRKQRKHIVGTSQVFGRIAKPFREQFRLAVICRKLFGFLQYNTIIDAYRSEVDDNGKITKANAHRRFWIHSAELYASYDTYAKIERGSLK